MFVVLVDIRVLFVGYVKCKCRKHLVETPKGNKNRDQIEQTESVKRKGEMRMNMLTRESK
jgi:hypothetical protein